MAPHSSQQSPPTGVRKGWNDGGQVAPPMDASLRAVRPGSAWLASSANLGPRLPRKVMITGVTFSVEASRCRPRSWVGHERALLRVRPATTLGCSADASGEMTESLSFQVPDVAVPYVLLQRTNLQRFGPALRMGRVRPPSWAVTLEGWLRREQVKRAFIREITEEFDGLRTFLPSRCKRLLDIGCGVGGIDVLFHHHYDLLGETPELYLLDRTETPSAPRYGFHRTSSFYNSLSVARDLLLANGVQPSNVHLLEVGSRDLDDVNEIDIVISLVSWGFHYPLDTYIEYVRRAVRPGGVVILDVRKGTGGYRELERTFGDASVILEDKKRWRFAVVRTLDPGTGASEKGE